MKWIKLFEDYSSNENLDIETILNSYLETAVWADYENPNEKSISDFSEEAKQEAKNDIILFVQKAGSLLDGLDPVQIGHDFWLTRRHHGAGFWDGDYDKEIGEQLTIIAQSFKDIGLMENDNEELVFV